MKKMYFTKAAVIHASSIALLFAFGSVQADFPSRNIELVVTYASGGSSDIAGRAFANAAQKHVDGNNVVVQNRAGAGGIVGTDYVYNAQPDGHVIQLARVAVLSVAPTIQDVPYDPERFTYLGMISTDPFACVTADSRYDSIEDLSEVIKNNPGTITYNSSGVGSLNQFAALSLLESLGVEDPATAAIHVPSQGEGPALSAVAGGHIDFFCGNLAPMLGQLKAGNVNALFVTSEERIEEIGDVPTAAEIGYPELESIVGWSGLVGPPGMPEEVVNYYFDLLERVSEDEGWNNSVIAAGSTPSITLGQEFKEFFSEQAKQYSELADRAGLR